LNQYKSSSSSVLLTWHAIKYVSKELGLDVFDFGGSLIESSDKMQHNYGATQIPYLNLSKYDGNTFKPFKSIKRRVRK